MLGLSLSEEIVEIQHGYILACDIFYYEWMSPDALGAMAISILRINLLVYYMRATVSLLGTSDGPFQVLLNSLALSFVLDLDNVVMSFKFPLLINFKDKLVSHGACSSLSKLQFKPCFVLLKRTSILQLQRSSGAR